MPEISSNGVSLLIKTLHILLYLPAVSRWQNFRVHMPDRFAQKVVHVINSMSESVQSASINQKFDKINCKEDIKRQIGVFSTLLLFLSIFIALKKVALQLL